MITASLPLEMPCLSFSMLSKTTLIIPAAGSGSRLEREVPKPFISIGGKSILNYTLSRFIKLDALRQIVVATSSDYIERAREILTEMVPAGIDVAVIEGGRERQHSIYNALEEVTQSELVIIHDAVRPFVTTAQIRKCCEEAIRHGASVLGVPAKDTIKQVNDQNLVRETPSRNYLWQAQTPQVFKTEIIKKAYKKAFEANFIGTDDASLVERLGYPVKMVEGDRSNFKITYPLDLKLAQLLLSEQDE